MSRMRETMATANVHKAGQLRNQMKILARVTSGRELMLNPASEYSARPNTTPTKTGPTKPARHTGSRNRSPQRHSGILFMASEQASPSAFKR